jgi:hypothetical protein
MRECAASTQKRLVNINAVERFRGSCSVLGLCEAGDRLLAAVERSEAFLRRCLEEADRVLHGDLRAASRLYLLLREPALRPVHLPLPVFQLAAHEGKRDVLQAIDGDALLRTIAGVVRAANQPAEATEMIERLGHLVQPLLMLEAAMGSVEDAARGSPDRLRDTLTAWMAPHWRYDLTSAETTLPAWGPDDAGVDNWVRPPYDLEVWKNPINPLGPGIWDIWPCAGSTHKAMSEIDRFGPRYTIESLSNPRACAGQMITIRGKNFGPSGRVYFPSPDPDDPAFGLGQFDPNHGILGGVEAVRWTDSKIDVVVPLWATGGDLHLNAYTRHHDPCTTIDVYRLGNKFRFEGGLAKFLSISVGGIRVDLESTKIINLRPNDAVAIAWFASGPSSTAVTVRLLVGSTELWRRDTPGGWGGTVLAVPDTHPQEPRHGVLEFAATSACGALKPWRIPVVISVPPVLTIEYIEVTQGVQGARGDVLAGAAMPTVANKDTAVRVHMNCDRGGWYQNRLDKITGTLAVDGKSLKPTNVRNHVPDRGFASVLGLSRAEFTNDTLNFTIPAAWLTPGQHTLTARLVCDDPSGRIVVSRTIVWSWAAKSPMRVRALWMGLYASKDGMLRYLRDALDFLPTPLTNLGIAKPEWHSHTYDLSSDEGWDDLLDDLEDLWDDYDEASGVRWVGIIPPSERYTYARLAQQGRSGTPSIAVLAIGDRPEIAAHELGHSFGLNHINLGGAAGPYDAAADGGMLRRPPFDVRASVAIGLPAGDLMSYLQPVRPGITTWMRLFNMNF